MQRPLLVAVSLQRSLNACPWKRIEAYDQYPTESHSARHAARPKCVAISLRNISVAREGHRYWRKPHQLARGSVGLRLVPVHFTALEYAYRTSYVQESVLETPITPPPRRRLVKRKHLVSTTPPCNEPCSSAPSLPGSGARCDVNDCAASSSVVHSSQPPNASLLLDAVTDDNAMRLRGSDSEPTTRRAPARRDYGQSSPTKPLLHSVALPEPPAVGATAEDIISYLLTLRRTHISQHLSVTGDTVAQRARVFIQEELMLAVAPPDENVTVRAYQLAALPRDSATSVVAQRLPHRAHGDNMGMVRWSVELAESVLTTCSHFEMNVDRTPIMREAVEVLLTGPSGFTEGDEIPANTCTDDTMTATGSSHTRKERALMLTRRGKLLLSLLPLLHRHACCAVFAKDIIYPAVMKLMQGRPTKSQPAVRRHSLPSQQGSAKHATASPIEARNEVHNETKRVAPGVVHPTQLDDSHTVQLLRTLLTTVLFPEIVRGLRFLCLPSLSRNTTLAGTGDKEVVPFGSEEQEAFSVALAVLNKGMGGRLVHRCASQGHSYEGEACAYVWFDAPGSKTESPLLTPPSDPRRFVRCLPTSLFVRGFKSFLMGVQARSDPIDRDASMITVDGDGVSLVHPTNNEGVSLSSHLDSQGSKGRRASMTRVNFDVLLPALQVCLHGSFFELLLQGPKEEGSPSPSDAHSLVSGVLYLFEQLLQRCHRVRPHQLSSIASAFARLLRWGSATDVDASSADCASAFSDSRARNQLQSAALREVQLALWAGHPSELVDSTNPPCRGTTALPTSCRFLFPHLVLHHLIRSAIVKISKCTVYDIASFMQAIAKIYESITEKCQTTRDQEKSSQNHIGNVRYTLSLKQLSEIETTVSNYLEAAGKLLMYTTALSPPLTHYIAVSPGSAVVGPMNAESLSATGTTAAVGEAGTPASGGMPIKRLSGGEYSLRVAPYVYKELGFRIRRAQQAVSPREVVLIAESAAVLGCRPLMALQEVIWRTLRSPSMRYSMLATHFSALLLHLLECPTHPADVLFRRYCWCLIVRTHGEAITQENFFNTLHAVCPTMDLTHRAVQHVHSHIGDSKTSVSLDTTAVHTNILCDVFDDDRIWRKHDLFSITEVARLVFAFSARLHTLDTPMMRKWLLRAGYRVMLHLQNSGHSSAANTNNDKLPEELLLILYTVCRRVLRDADFTGGRSLLFDFNQRKSNYAIERLAELTALSSLFEATKLLLAPIRDRISGSFCVSAEWDQLKSSSGSTYLSFSHAMQLVRALADDVWIAPVVLGLAQYHIKHASDVHISFYLACLALNQTSWNDSWYPLACPSAGPASRSCTRDKMHASHNRESLSLWVLEHLHLRERGRNNPRPLFWSFFPWLLTGKGDSYSEGGLSLTNGGTVKDPSSEVRVATSSGSESLAFQEARDTFNVESEYYTHSNPMIDFVLEQLRIQCHSFNMLVWVVHQLFVTDASLLTGNSCIENMSSIQQKEILNEVYCKFCSLVQHPLTSANDFVLFLSLLVRAEGNSSKYATEDVPRAQNGIHALPRRDDHSLLSVCLKYVQSLSLFQLVLNLPHRNERISPSVMRQLLHGVEKLSSPSLRVECMNLVGPFILQSVGFGTEENAFDLFVDLLEIVVRLAPAMLFPLLKASAYLKRSSDTNSEIGALMHTLVLLDRAGRGRSRSEEMHMLTPFVGSQKTLASVDDGEDAAVETAEADMMDVSAQYASMLAGGIGNYRRAVRSLHAHVRRVLTARAPNAWLGIISLPMLALCVSLPSVRQDNFLCSKAVIYLEQMLRRCMGFPAKYMVVFVDQPTSTVSLPLYRKVISSQSSNLGAALAHERLSASSWPLVALAPYFTLWKAKGEYFVWWTGDGDGISANGSVPVRFRVESIPLDSVSSRGDRALPQGGVFDAMRGISLDAWRQILRVSARLAGVPYRANGNYSRQRGRHSRSPTGHSGTVDVEGDATTVASSESGNGCGSTDEVLSAMNKHIGVIVVRYRGLLFFGGFSAAQVRFVCDDLGPLDFLSLVHDIVETYACQTEVIDRVYINAIAQASCKERIEGRPRVCTQMPWLLQDVPAEATVLSDDCVYEWLACAWQIVEDLASTSALDMTNALRNIQAAVCKQTAMARALTSSRYAEGDETDAMESLHKHVEQTHVLNAAAQAVTSGEERPISFDLGVVVNFLHLLEVLQPASFERHLSDCAYEVDQQDADAGGGQSFEQKINAVAPMTMSMGASVILYRILRNLGMCIESENERDSSSTPLLSSVLNMAKVLDFVSDVRMHWLGRDRVRLNTEPPHLMCFRPSSAVIMPSSGTNGYLWSQDVGVRSLDMSDELPESKQQAELDNALLRYLILPPIPTTSAVSSAGTAHVSPLQEHDEQNARRRLSLLHSHDLCRVLELLLPRLEEGADRRVNVYISVVLDLLVELLASASAEDIVRVTRTLLPLANKMDTRSVGLSGVQIMQNEIRRLLSNIPVLVANDVERFTYHQIFELFSTLHYPTSSGLNTSSSGVGSESFVATPAAQSVRSLLLKRLPSPQSIMPVYEKIRCDIARVGEEVVWASFLMESGSAQKHSLHATLCLLFIVEMTGGVEDAVGLNI